MTGQSSTSFGLPHTQSRHLSRMLLIGVGIDITNLPHQTAPPPDYRLITDRLPLGYHHR